MKQVRHHDSRLFVYDRNKGGVTVHDFSKLQRFPVNIAWDDSDDRILVCEARRNTVEFKTDSESQSSSGLDQDVESEVDIVIFFATTEDGLLLQDSFPRKSPHGDLLGIIVPRLYFRSIRVVSEDSKESSGQSKIYSKMMRDFVGMGNDIEMDPVAKLALLDFSYNLTLGKLDEAYRAIKSINSPSVWENMAQMCIKTKRLDVAEVCLGNMGHARGAAALRDSRKEDSIEVSVGVLAIQLGLNDEAARMFRECNRFDLLNALYQSAGIWEKAIKIATTHDRIHLKTTHYNYAKYLESIGDIETAIGHYELSDNARTEVPRMLFDSGRMEDLEDYVLKSEDPALLKWWAAYLESTERFEKACKYYRKAGDFLSLVRISCFKVI